MSGCSLFELGWPVPTLLFPSVARSGLGRTLLRAEDGILLCTCGDRRAEFPGTAWALPWHRQHVLPVSCVMSRAAEEALGHAQPGWAVVSKGLLCPVPQFPHV